MRQNLERSLKAVLVHEGGYVNHPDDPGGATNKGVTQATYDAYRKARECSRQSVRCISEAEVFDIYKSRYWDAIRGDELPAGVDYAVFDFGVNSGPSRAIKFLQRIVGVDDDGQIGPLTLAAMEGSSPAVVIETLCDRRLAWLETLRHWRTFGKGWSRRINGVERLALSMVTSVPPAIESPPSSDPAPNIGDDTLEPVNRPAHGGFFRVLAAALHALFERK